MIGRHRRDVPEGECRGKKAGNERSRRDGKFWSSWNITFLVWKMHALARLCSNRTYGNERLEEKEWRILAAGVPLEELVERISHSFMSKRTKKVSRVANLHFDWVLWVDIWTSAGMCGLFRECIHRFSSEKHVTCVYMLTCQTEENNFRTKSM